MLAALIDRLTLDELALEGWFEPRGDVQISGLVDPVMLCRWRPLSQCSED